MIDSADVVVVGAGLAGLRCADVLRSRGVSVVVLEARARVGGRTWSAPIDGAPGAVVDLGGQWIGPGQRRLEALARELSIDTFPTHHAGKKILDVCGKVSTYKRSIPSLPIFSLLELELSIRKVERMGKRVDPAAPLAGKDAAMLDGSTVEEWTRRNVRSAKVRACLDAAVRTVFGAEARDLSMLYFLSYMRAGEGMMHLVEIEGGAQERRFVGGAQSIALGLAARLGDRVVTSAPVRAIEQEGVGFHGAVIVKSDTGTLKAKYVVVAIPPALAGRIDYAPLLPVARDQLTQRFPMGATVKCVAVYSKAFWREAGFSGELVSDRGPASVVFDNGQHDGSHPALLAFVVGQAARDWSTQSAQQRRDAILAQYVRAFGPAAASPIAYVEQDWSTEEWTRGCPTGLMPPGGMTACGDALRAPCGRLHWAGTETATEYTGYMEGALQSGDRAAAEVLARL